MKRALLLVSMLLLSREAYADWSIIKGQLQGQVQITAERKDELVLSAPSLSRSITITQGQRPHSDIYTLLVRRRGGNPYRIWVASIRFWNDPTLPKHQWGALFKTPFLRILRPPRNR